MIVLINQEGNENGSKQKIVLFRKNINKHVL